MSQRNVTITCNDYLLEGVVHTGKESEKARCVITHPHPQYGGSMDNNVVYALCDALPEKNISCLRFNFGGVGGSLGSFSGGAGEAEELEKAIEFFKKDFDGPVFVAGYSFGAYVALLMTQNSYKPDALCCVSPPIDFMDAGFPSQGYLPMYVICGDQDAFCSKSSILGALKDHSAPTIISGADHFWSGFEKEMASHVADFFLPLIA